MYLYKTVTGIFLWVIIAVMLTSEVAHAQYTPSENVTLTMYQLTEKGGNTGIPCNRGDLSFGCTAEGDDPEYAYPFDSSTITISIDGTNGPDNDSADYRFSYIQDVVPQEIDIVTSSRGNKPVAALRAQAIASRTYIYQRILHIDAYGIPDNSNGFQVFIPYRYQTLSSVQKLSVGLATQRRLYMSEADGTNPIEALYGSDNRAETTNGNRSYLQGVPDPINEPFGCVLDIDRETGEILDYGENSTCGTGLGGLSSKGTSRWSFGHTSSRGPVAREHPNYPRDNFGIGSYTKGLGDFWSVKWERAEQILTHYYTGIHIRDANNNNQRQTAGYRWVPLLLEWTSVAQQASSNGESQRLCIGSSYRLSFVIQNTGTVPWDEDDLTRFAFDGFATETGAQAVTAASGQAISSPIAGTVEIGKPYTATVQIDATGLIPGTNYQMLFNMFTNPGGVGEISFSNPGGGYTWERYKVPIVADDCDDETYLPLLPNNGLVAGQ